MIMKSPQTPWIVTEPSAEDDIRLFCFPYAGGAASTYKEWAHFLPNCIGVYPIQLPGRENRILEPHVTTMTELTDTISKAIVRYLDRPFILFGHSIGGRIAFELARVLKRWELTPLRLIVSGSRAPNISEPSPLHLLSDDAFIHELKRFSGTPDEFFECKELMEIYLPILRADFTIDETYVFTDGELLECPISAFGGTEDTEALKEEIEPWAMHTSGSFTLEMMSGNHFFIQSEQKRFLKRLSNVLLESMKEPH